MNTIPPQSQSLYSVLHCSASLCNRPAIVQLFLIAAISFNTPSLNSEKSISALNELINQRLFHKSQPSSCPFPAHQQHSMLSGYPPVPPVSPAKTKATHSSIGVGGSPLPHPSPGPCDLARQCELPLDVSVPKQRCSSCYLGRLRPQKYLVSSHSVKWN